MPTKVYKVVRKTNDGLQSALIGNTYKVTYKVGEQVKPFPGTKLFAFLDLKEARDYRSKGRKQGQDYHLYEAQATGLSGRGSWLFWVQVFKDLKNKPFRSFLDKSKSYKSPILCSSIMLTKKVR